MTARSMGIGAAPGKPVAAPAPDVITDFCIKARHFLVPRWIECHKHEGDRVATLSTGMCRFTTRFLREAMSLQFGPVWRADAGYPGVMMIFEEDAGGIQSAGGGWHAHYWLTSADGSLIIDITGDQFGLPPVIVTTDHSRFRSNESTERIEDALGRCSWTANEWLDDWRAIGIAT